MFGLPAYSYIWCTACVVKFVLYESLVLFLQDICKLLHQAFANPSKSDKKSAGAADYLKWLFGGSAVKRKHTQN